MCGIAGMITTRATPGEKVDGILRRAEVIQQHRGPDGRGRGQWSIGERLVGLAQQRLAILDLSQAGHQPMTIAPEGGVMVYNGEIYNYLEIRQELEALGRRFSSRSDTEVLLTALHQYGIETTLNRCNGMWAFAWLDPTRRRLFLARDRLGVKPLYYGMIDDQLYFASEVKAILAMTGGRWPLNLQAVGEYLVQSLAHGDDETLFRGIHRLPAGHLVEIDLTSPQILVDPRPYWRLPTHPLTPPPGAGELIEEVRHLFLDAVRLRLRSDVPVGVLLSGGVDSSAIACAMQAILGPAADLNLLSAVSPDPRFDESPFIDRVADHLKRPVHRVLLELEPARAMTLLEQTTWHQDAPVGSFSNVAHYLLMEQAKAAGITVILSGQGADELLCGYRKYLGFFLQYLFHQGAYGRLVATGWSFWRNGTIINQFSFREGKRYLPRWLTRLEPNITGPALAGFRPIPSGLRRGMTVQERQAADLTRFSIPPLTHYEDRSSMAWSREIRLPFLDYRLVELLAPLPPEWKLQQGWTKYIFRQALAPLVPAEVIWRKDKQGFINPQAEWLKHDLQGEVLKRFAPDAMIFNLGLVDREQLLRKYQAYCRQPAESGRIAFTDIFNPLALEVWLQRFAGSIQLEPGTVD